jgi:23S rRNA pseudouridine2605 synthase
MDEEVKQGPAAGKKSRAAKSAKATHAPELDALQIDATDLDEQPRSASGIELEEEGEEEVQYPAIVRREERLQKIIASAGVTSRRKAEDLILEGRVQVNGATITELGTKADAALDHIRVDNKLLPKRGDGGIRLRYAVLNKPKGYITSASDPEGRPTVMEFFAGGTRVFPVGRLDYQSEGLLLMTNDGELANLLTRAANKVQKVYLVKISGKPSENALAQLRAGIMIDKGRTKDEHLGRVLTQPAGIRRVRDAENPWYEVTLTEGRNREIRKMFEEVGHFVEKIRRVGFGPLVLDVAPGEVRELTAEEVLQLQRAARGIRTISKTPIPPISVPALRRKIKRTGVAGIRPPTAQRPGSADGPVLRERPKPPRPRPVNSDGSAPAGRSSPLGRTDGGRPLFVPRPSSRPSSADRPVSSARPPAGGRPTTGVRPPSSDRPAFGARPSSGSRPTSSSRPASGGRPASGSRPPSGSRPAAGSTSSARPSFGSRPPSGGRPSSGSRPSAGGRPAGKSSRPGSGKPKSR